MPRSAKGSFEMSGGVWDLLITTLMFTLTLNVMGQMHTLSGGDDRLIRTKIRLPGGLCMPCASGDFECPNGLVCDQQRCVLDGRNGTMCPGIMCEKCGTDRQCAQMFTCLSGRCVGAERDLARCEDQNITDDDEMPSVISDLCGPCIPGTDFTCLKHLHCIAHHCIHLQEGPSQCGIQCKKRIMQTCRYRGHCETCDGMSGRCAYGHKCINGHCVRNGMRVESCVPANVCERCNMFRPCVGKVCNNDGTRCEDVHCYSGHCATSKEQAVAQCAV